MATTRMRLIAAAAALCLAGIGLCFVAVQAEDEMGLEAGARVELKLADGRAMTGTIVSMHNNQGQKDGVKDKFRIEHADGLQIVEGYWKDYISIVSTGSETPKARYEFTRGDGSVFQGDTFGIMYFEIDLGLAKKGLYMGQDITSIEVADAEVEQSADGSRLTIICPHCGKPITVRVKADK